MFREHPPHRRESRVCDLVISALLALVVTGTARAASDGTVSQASTATSRGRTPGALDWETGEGRSYLVPALEIPGFIFLLNRVDRYATKNHEVYETNGHTIWNQLKDQHWTIDHDGFSVNHLGHPYSGTVYFGLARSTGVDFWQSLLFAEAGSFLWEMAGEKSDPSINDQIFTPFGGTLLGEPLFRMANLLLESGGDDPGWMREAAALVISPPVGLNRLAFGNRFDAMFPSRRPATSLRLQIGTALSQSTHNVSDQVEGYTGMASVFFDYGLPGKPGYRYERPFDYFSFGLSTTTSNAFDALVSRGLLVGRDYGVGQATRGVWGVYGSYDYIAPEVFRVASAALSLGTTWQSWLSEGLAAQGTALAGLGYAGAGTLHRAGERNYHYGLAPQALIDLRLIAGDRAMANIAAREYYVTDSVAPSPHGRENVLRVDSSLTVRLLGPHGVGLRYTVSYRDATYSEVAFRDELVGTLNLVYVWLGQKGFGAVEWR